MNKYLYDISFDVINQFRANELKIVATHFLDKNTQTWSEQFNEGPATYLFDNVKSITAANGGYRLNSRAFIEPCTDGIDYRFYNNIDPSCATQMLELVIGDPTVDIIQFNPGMKITLLEGNKTVLLENISQINNGLWVNAPLNKEFQSYGVMYSISNVRDGDLGSVRMIADYYEGSRTIDWNRGSGRRAFCKLSIDPSCALDMNVQNEDRFDPKIADYIFKEADILDANIEGFAMITYTGMKQTETGSFTLSINELFNDLTTV